MSHKKRLRKIELVTNVCYEYECIMSHANGLEKKYVMLPPSSSPPSVVYSLAVSLSLTISLQRESDRQRDRQAKRQTDRIDRQRDRKADQGSCALYLPPTL